MPMTTADHDALRADARAFNGTHRADADGNVRRMTDYDVGRRGAQQLVTRLRDGTAEPSDLWLALRTSLQHKAPHEEPLERGFVEALGAAIASSTVEA